MNISRFKDHLKWRIVSLILSNIPHLSKIPHVSPHNPFPSLRSFSPAWLVACLVVFEEHLSRLDELIIRRLVQTTTRQSVLCYKTLCALCALYAVCFMLCVVCCVLCASHCYMLWRRGVSAEDSWRHWKCSITWCKGPYICAPIYHSYKIHNLSPSCRCVHRAVCDLDCS